MRREAMREALGREPQLGPITAVAPVVVVAAAAERRGALTLLWGWALGGTIAVLTWLGWLGLAPTFGFPVFAPAAMLNAVLLPGLAPESLVGWGVLAVGLAGLAIAYAVASARGLFRPRLLSGALYGIALWVIAGAILMPLMGLASPAGLAAPSAPMAGMPVSPADSMNATFMMLHLGPLAPAGALIAWLVFGAILGATGSRVKRSPT
jgi:hypothetical protein